MMNTFFKCGTVSLLAIGLVSCSSTSMVDHDTHNVHQHAHGEDCGHQVVMHDGHMDYVHDGHLHHVHDAHVDEHIVKITAANPVAEKRAEAGKHDDHVHGPGDTLHAMIPHGDHVDYLHDGHLHHVHNDHIDEHGPL